MRKSIEQLINVGYDIKLALNLAHFALYLYEEDAYIEFSVTRKITKEVLQLIPNSFTLFPDSNGVLKLRIYEMTQSSE